MQKVDSYFITVNDVTDFEEEKLSKTTSAEKAS